MLAPKLIPEELHHWSYKEVKSSNQEQPSMNVPAKKISRYVEWGQQHCNPVCQTLSNAFEIKNAIALVSTR